MGILLGAFLLPDSLWPGAAWLFARSSPGPLAAILWRSRGAQERSRCFQERYDSGQDASQTGQDLQAGFRELQDALRVTLGD